MCLCYNRIFRSKNNHHKKSNERAQVFGLILCIWYAMKCIYLRDGCVWVSNPNKKKWSRFSGNVWFLVRLQYSIWIGNWCVKINQSTFLHLIFLTHPLHPSSTSLSFTHTFIYNASRDFLKSVTYFFLVLEFYGFFLL